MQIYGCDPLAAPPIILSISPTNLLFLRQHLFVKYFLVLEIAPIGVWFSEVLPGIPIADPCHMGWFSEVLPGIHMGFLPDT